MLFYFQEIRLLFSRKSGLFIVENPTLRWPRSVIKASAVALSSFEIAASYECKQ